MAEQEPELNLAGLPSNRQTQKVVLAPGATSQLGELFRTIFPRRRAIIVADTNTWPVAGAQAASVLQSSGALMGDSLIFEGKRLLAAQPHVDRIEMLLRERPDAVPIAVGSGTLNDLTKLASHRADRQYLCVATAASMDGYTAFGASITRDGAKSTYGCPAPVAVVADLDVIVSAPRKMASWGYADLLAKVTAGADWILAGILGVEPIDPEAWGLAQTGLREWVGDPEGVSRQSPRAISALMKGLLRSGFAMQAANSSRPASGAEHQFSHLWDMQHHTFEGEPVPHGWKVGVALLAVAGLYEALLQWSFARLDVNRCCEKWPPLNQAIDEARAVLGSDELARVAVEELSAKYISRDQLREQLTILKSTWPDLQQRLWEQLLPTRRLKQMLQAAGAPAQPEQIGLSRERLRLSFRQAYCIRRRFTVLDLVVRAGIFEPLLRRLCDRPTAD